MQSKFYEALRSFEPYSQLVEGTFREFAGDEPPSNYAVYYEVSDNRDSDLEGVNETGSTRIQLDVFSTDASQCKAATESAILAIQESPIVLISAISRSKPYDLETRRYGHSVDLFIHY